MTQREVEAWYPETENESKIDSKIDCVPAKQSPELNSWYSDFLLRENLIGYSNTDNRGFGNVGVEKKFHDSEICSKLDCLPRKQFLELTSCYAMDFPRREDMTGYPNTDNSGVGSVEGEKKFHDHEIFSEIDSVPKKQFLELNSWYAIDFPRKENMTGYPNTDNGGAGSVGGEKKFTDEDLLTLVS